MPWQPLAIADVQTEIQPDEAALLAAINGSSAALSSILANCLAEIQASILVGGNQIGPTGTVPDQIRSDCIALVRWRWFTSLPKTDLQSDHRAKQFTAAQERLEKIRDGKEKVEIPTQPQTAAATPTNPVQAIRKGHHMQDWSALGET